MGEVVAEAWAVATPKTDLGSISKALKGVMCSLKEWSQEKFGSVRKKLEALRSFLVELHAGEE